LLYLSLFSKFPRYSSSSTHFWNQLKILVEARTFANRVSFQRKILQIKKHFFLLKQTDPCQNSTLNV